MKIRKLIYILMITIIILNYCGFSRAVIKEDEKTEVFYDDFSSEKLDMSKWLIAEKAWGGNNGGVVSKNVSVSDGVLKLEAHGNKYEEDVSGINKPDGKKTGAAIATKEYFGSGSYEVVAKVGPELGACSAIWTFEYEEYYPGDSKYEELAQGGSYYAVNHEIDIEMPGRPAQAIENISYEYALCNTWVGERENEYTTSYTKLPSAQNDGNFHKYRFDWHTGDKDEKARVEFYIDDVLVQTNTTHVPTNKGRLWIGIWFPNGWAGNPEFDTTVFEIDSVKITPFNETGDTEPNETYGDDGWANPPEEDEKKPLEFDMLLKSDKAELKAGESFTVIASINKLNKNKSNGLIALSGKLEYDSEVLQLDLDSLSGIGNWNFSKKDYNENNFKFITDRDDYAQTPEDVLRLSFKVKEDINIEKTLVKLTYIKAGTGELENGIIGTDDIQIEINIMKEVLRGDIDLDGKITVNDLAQIKLHYIEKQVLMGDSLIRADLDKDGEITVSDIAIIKSIIIQF